MMIKEAKFCFEARWPLATGWVEIDVRLTKLIGYRHLRPFTLPYSEVERRILVGPVSLKLADQIRTQIRKEFVDQVALGDLTEMVTEEPTKVSTGRIEDQQAVQLA